MTYYFVDASDGNLVSFEENPQGNVNAAAKTWSARRAPDDWYDVPAGSGIASTVVWGGDYYPIPEDQVPEFQRRCVSQAQAHAARAAMEK